MRGASIVTGVRFDAKLRDEVVARVERLNMPSHPLDLTAQMLEYSGRRQ